LELNHPGKKLRTLNRKLGDRPQLVFDFHRQTEVLQKVADPVKNGGQLARRKPVLDIVVHPSLEKTGLLHAAGAAAINEPLGDVPNLGDVEVGGDHVAIG
jgi:hypothetical protein